MRMDDVQIGMLSDNSEITLLTKMLNSSMERYSLAKTFAAIDPNHEKVYQAIADGAAEDAGVLMATLVDIDPEFSTHFMTGLKSLHSHSEEVKDTIQEVQQASSEAEEGGEPQDLTP